MQITFHPRAFLVVVAEMLALLVALSVAGDMALWSWLWLWLSLCLLVIVDPARKTLERSAVFQHARAGLLLCSLFFL